MSKLLSRIAGFFSNRSFVGADKGGNRYFSRTEEIDGLLKEKRWVVFKGEEDPTSIPVEWISWLNGQRKKAPTPEEMAELEARREQLKLNVALLKKEEEERKAREGSIPKGKKIDKVAGPDLKSFIRQFPGASEGPKKLSQTYQNQYQSLRNPQDLVQPSGQGHGNRQHDACHTILDSKYCLLDLTTTLVVAIQSL